MNDPSQETTVANAAAASTAEHSAAAAAANADDAGTKAQRATTTVSPNSTTKSTTSPVTTTTYPSFVRQGLKEEIVKQVVRKKLAKQRHLVLPASMDAAYLENLFADMVQLFDPQTVTYNGGIAKVPKWKISCYLEVMEGGIPTTNPNLELCNLFRPILDACNVIFMDWYRQQHACNDPSRLSGKENRGDSRACRRLMTFITRYTPKPGEQALLKHVDGAGKVDGSVVVALPMDKDEPFEGGGLTFWDGVKRDAVTGKRGKDEIHYDTRCGDLALIDRAVWHQADPITAGTRWALVIFYKVL